MVTNPEPICGPRSAGSKRKAALRSPVTGPGPAPMYWRPPALVPVVSSTAVGYLALEAIQKLRSDTMFTVLDLQGIGDEGAQAIARELKGNTTLTTLSLGNNSIGVAGRAALVYALRDSPNLVAADGVDGLKGVCAENSKIALGLLEKAKGEAFFLNGWDIEALKLRLPSVRVVAREMLGELATVDLLEKVSEMIDEGGRRAEWARLADPPAGGIKDLLREAIEVQEGRRTYVGKGGLPFPVP
jgi:hypothetical protein